MTSKTLLHLLVLMSSVVHVHLTNTSSCISFIDNSSTFNGSHTELTFSTSCEFSSIRIARISEENVGLDSGMIGGFCQIIGNQRYDRNKKCDCSMQKRSSKQRQCHMRFPVIRNCTVLQNQSFEMRISESGNRKELLKIHSAFRDIAQWRVQKCTTTITTTANNDDTDKTSLMHALAAVSTITVLLLVVDAIVICLWLRKQRTGKSDLEKTGKASRREKDGNSTTVEEEDASGYTNIRLPARQIPKIPRIFRRFAGESTPEKSGKPGRRERAGTDTNQSPAVVQEEKSGYSALQLPDRLPGEGTPEKNEEPGRREEASRDTSSYTELRLLGVAPVSPRGATGAKQKAVRQPMVGNQDETYLEPVKVCKRLRT